jgi:hypothetical protein
MLDFKNWKKLEKNGKNWKNFWLILANIFFIFWILGEMFFQDYSEGSSLPTRGFLYIVGSLKMGLKSILNSWKFRKNRKFPKNGSSLKAHNKILGPNFKKSHMLAKDYELLLHMGKKFRGFYCKNFELLAYF